jgi:hypothetical protein
MATGPDEFANKLPLRYNAAYKLMKACLYEFQGSVLSVVLSKIPSLFCISGRGVSTGTLLQS